MKNFKIPIFKLKFGLKSKLKFIKGAWDILSSDRPLGESKYVKEFEDKFGELINSKYTIACSNGTTAIEMALKAIDVKGKKVLIPSNTFFATSVAVTNSGGIVELVDMESTSFSLCSDLFQSIPEHVCAYVLKHLKLDEYNQAYVNLQGKISVRVKKSIPWTRSNLIFLRE